MVCGTKRVENESIVEKNGKDAKAVLARQRVQVQKHC